MHDAFARMRPIDLPGLAVVFADRKYHNEDLYDRLNKNLNPIRVGQAA